MSLDALTGAGSGHTPSLASSSALGISQQSDFDFVGVSSFLVPALPNNAVTSFCQPVI